MEYRSGEAQRLYSAILRHHLDAHRQMAFVSGPRQVGKTTVCRGVSNSYLNWDDPDQRRLILAGPAKVAEYAGLSSLRGNPRVLVLDELHKFRKWKAFLKGFFDSYGSQVKIVVTGSSKMDAYRKGGDSLMGRYFPYRMHPFTVGELLRTRVPETPVLPPRALDEEDWNALLEHGGYPEPFLKRSRSFTLRWQRLRTQQLLREDVRDLTQIQELAQLEVLAQVLSERSGQQLIYANLAQQVNTSINTVRRWIDTLVQLHFGFLLRPWYKNVNKSLRKEPKWFLRDWGVCSDPGQRAETFIACHLLKAVETWTDLGLGEFALHYLRDKDKREVDFLVVRDKKPWFLVEAKQSETRLSEALARFQKQLAAPHAFQAVLESEFVAADCFKQNRPIAVPARTLLSQLV